MAERRKPRRAARAERRARRAPARVEPHSIEKGVEQFAEEVGTLGEKFGKECEAHGKNAESWFRSTFGVVGPFLSSILGLIMPALFTWVLSLVNVPIGSGLLQNINYFLLAHIGWFFLIFLFFSYTSYVSKSFPIAYRPFAPLVSSAGITVCLWLVANALRVVNASLGIGTFSSVSMFIETNLLLFFLVFAFIGYVATILCSAAGRCGSRGTAPAPPKKAPAKPSGDGGRTSRLYRSGDDRILGGVCGGIAEYLGVDPVIIRFVWVIGTLASFGTGVLLYIIMWIIMPRNPHHDWKH